jgi:hypothetical protein
MKARVMLILAVLRPFVHAALQFFLGPRANPCCVLCKIGPNGGKKGSSGNFSDLIRDIRVSKLR